VTFVRNMRSTDPGGQPALSAVQAVVFCAVVGLFCSTLNLAFLLGDSLKTSAEAAGASEVCAVGGVHVGRERGAGEACAVCVKGMSSRK
jgi:hypothetical protein